MVPFRKRIDNYLQEAKIKTPSNGRLFTNRDPISSKEIGSLSYFIIKAHLPNDLQHFLVGGEFKIFDTQL